jgi:hypothetical protein
MRRMHARTRAPAIHQRAKLARTQAPGRAQAIIYTMSELASLRAQLAEQALATELSGAAAKAERRARSRARAASAIRGGRGPLASFNLNTRRGSNGPVLLVLVLLIRHVSSIWYS